jgi:4-hydroxy-4-methyl-2-oxoglutarate aldolase
VNDELTLTADPAVATAPLDAETFARLAATDSPTLSNAIEATQARALVDGFAGPRVRCLFPQLGVMAGYAVTVQFDTTSPGPAAIGAGLRELTEIVEAAPKPVVLVYQDIGPRPGGAAIFGEYAARLMMRLGAVGVVTDGSVRDVLEVEALGMHYFAAGAVVSHGNPRLVRVGVPVVVDGMYVEPGDLVHGDANGVLNVPLAVASELPDLVDRVKSGEQETFRFLESDDFTRDEALRRSSL